MARRKAGEVSAVPAERPDRLARIPNFTGKETVKEAAHMWAAAGAKVIPLSRGTKSPGSILGKGWQFQASSDPSQVEAWFSRTDVGGVAIECGRSGVVVLDVDENSIGVDGGVIEHTRGLDDLRAHRYFAMPEDKEIGNSKGELSGWKGDVRGFGGCVVVYPTPHPEGGKYVLHPDSIGAEIPPLPQEIKDQLPVRSAEVDPCSLQDALGALATSPHSRDDYLVRAYVERYENRVNRGESRHDSALKTMCNIFRDVLKERAGQGEFELVYDHIFDSMTTPVSPERPARSEDWTRADLDRCISWAYSQALGEWHERVEAGVAEALNPDSPLASTKWRLMDEEELEALEFPPDLVHESLPSIGIGQLYGDSMAGKTFVALDLAYRVSRGMPWFGREIDSPGDVVYIYKEGAKSVQGRARAWRKKHGKTPKDAPGKVKFIPAQGMMSSEQDIRELEAVLARAGVRPKLLLGDTQALLLDTADENDNAEAGKHTRLLKSLSERMQCLVLLLHHTTKDGSVANGARGAGGWKGQSDSLISVEYDRELKKRRLHVRKYKDGAEWERPEGFFIQQVGDHQVEAVLVATGAVDLAELTERSRLQEQSDQRYLEAVRQLGAEATASGVARELNVSPQAAGKKLKALQESGHLDRSGSVYHPVAEEPHHEEVP